MTPAIGFGGSKGFHQAKGVASWPGAEGSHSAKVSSETSHRLVISPVLDRRRDGLWKRIPNSPLSPNMIAIQHSREIGSGTGRPFPSPASPVSKHSALGVPVETVPARKGVSVRKRRRRQLTRKTKLYRLCQSLCFSSSPNVY